MEECSSECFPIVLQRCERHMMTRCTGCQRIWDGQAQCPCWGEGCTGGSPVLEKERHRCKKLVVYSEEDLSSSDNDDDDVVLCTPPPPPTTRVIDLTASSEEDITELSEWEVDDSDDDGGEEEEEWRRRKRSCPYIEWEARVEPSKYATLLRSVSVNNITCTG